MPQLSALFNQYLGREPSDSERQIFTDEINKGGLDWFGLSNFLQGSQEYQRKQIPGMMNDYQSALKGVNTDFVAPLQQKGFDAANAEMRRMGRPDSTALASRYAQVSGNINNDLAKTNFGVTSNMLANYYAGLSGGGRVAADAAVGNKYSQEAAATNYGYQSKLMAQQDQYNQKYADMNQSMSNKNNWFELGSGLLQGAGAGLGGYWQSQAMKTPQNNNYYYGGH